MVCFIQNILFDLFNLSTNSFSYPFTKQHFILYKQVTSQYDDPDILQYVNLLVPEKIKKESFAIQLDGIGEASEFIRLVMVDTSMQSADVNEDVLMEEGRIAITEDHLANLTEGPVYLELYREQEQLVRNRAKGGGKLVITYALKRQFTLWR